LRWRRDLEVHQQRFQGRDNWVVKDPFRLKYFRFEEEELWLLQQLDGTTTLDDLQRRFERKFSPQQVTPREIQRLFGQAHRSGLLLSDGAGQAGVLLEHRTADRWRKLWQLPGEVLCWRLRGFDPDQLLGRLSCYLGGLFSLPAVVLCLLLAVAALLSIASHWTEFCLRLPASQEYFGPTNWLALAVTLGLLKVCHEFGHGLACKRYGGECHEMGVLFLCFSPCLYCDVTDSWMIPSKWRRAAVGAAGMYVELWLASLATFLWWRTEPGLVHQLALNVMFVGSVSTLLFNANPLMRYDGYYILADLIEIPNLRSKADALLQGLFSHWLWGKKSTPAIFTPARQRWLLAYAAASGVYRWCVAAAILWFFYKLTEPYGFKVIGQILAVIAAVGLILRPLYILIRFLKDSWLWEGTAVPSSRGWVCLSLIGAAVLALLCLPLPYYVRCALRLSPEDAATVYVDVPGQIEKLLVQAGEEVQAGQPLLELQNLDLELATARLATQCQTQTAKVKVLRQRSLSDETARSEVAQAEQSLATLKEELAQRQEQLDKLVIKSPRSGIVIPAPRRPQDQATDQLVAWHGHLLEDRNRGATVAASDVVCLIGDLSRWEAVLAVDGHEVNFVQAGQTVDLLPAQLPGRRIHAQVLEVSQHDMQSTPAAMSSKTGGELHSTADAHGRERPTFVTYEALARFDDASALLANGGGGVARIHAGYQSAASRLWRSLCRTFHFDL
jgi:putative peptide zinc metalloprotease protein